ncbi:MAG TPA: terminase small subunit [Gemmatimonadales bacterium]|jgi:phage terminase small subunit|nr:terminase small subunit [Gemmatimonadales bacterium]
MSDSSLTPKQQRFVAEYLVDLNATQAAIRAGYSPASAEVLGSRLLRNAQIAAAIAKAQGKQLAKLELTAERVKEELARLAFLDPRQCFDEAGNLKPIQELDANTAAAIASFDVLKENLHPNDGKVDTVHRLRWVDKTRALEMLAKHFKLLTEVVEVKDGDKLIEKLLAGRKRAAQARHAETDADPDGDA